MYGAATNRQGMKFVLTGVALGLLASFGFARVMTGFLYDIKPTDALTFAVTPRLLCLVALARIAYCQH